MLLLGLQKINPRIEPYLQSDLCALLKGLISLFAAKL
jgi:hypothetical protein